MNLIDRHVLREWLQVLAFVLVAVIGLLLMQAMYDDFRDLIEKGAGVGEMAMYYAVKVPGYLSIVLPLSLLVSLLYALGKLHRNSEIVALRAAGIGMMRITRSIWAAGVVLSGVVWLVNSTVVPWSVEESRAFLENLDFRQQAMSRAQDQVGLRRVLTFDNQRQRRMWVINRYSQFLHRAYGVNVSELDAKQREKGRIRAREGYYDERRRCWVFYDGRETWLDPETGELLRTATFDEKVMPHFNEDPAIMLVFDIKPGDLSFFELRRIIDFFKVEENPKFTIYAVRYYGLLAEMLAPLIIIAIAIPFAVSGVRVNPAVGVSKAIGLVVLYIVVSKLCDTLGVRGVLQPVTAALVPSVLMLGVGGFFFVRMR